MRYLAAAVLVVILYGSLYPLAFAPPPGNPADLLLLSLNRSPRQGDAVANLLFYVPLGLLLRGHPVTLTLLGATLSSGLELMQAFVPGRVPSMWDIAFNTAGMALGVLARRLAGRLRPSARGGLEDPGALLLALAWPASQLMPFIPNLDRSEWIAAVQPLLTVPPAPVDLLHHFIYWLVFGTLIEAGLRTRSLRVPIFLLVEIGQAIVIDRMLGMAELAGGFLALLVPASWRRPPLVALLLGLMVMVEELRPFTPMAKAASFNWVPFRAYVLGDPGIGALVLLEKSFAYGALIWLLWRSRVPLAAASVGSALTLFALELAQTRLPGRLPDITDALIALMLAAGIAALSPKPTPSSGSPPRQGLNG